MVKKLKVAVLMGGKSPEHQISLLTGREIAKNLSPKKYDPLSIIISRNGKSFRLNNKEYLLGQLSTVNCQLFIIAMHGPYGEDGTIQGLLDAIGVPYTGSGVLASALGIDKPRSMMLFDQAGLEVPEFFVIHRDHADDVPGAVAHAVRAFGFPTVVKPANRGSSVGVTIAKTADELAPGIAHAFEFAGTALIQRYIPGTELTCGVVET